MNYQIEITGTGTREEIATALRTMANAINEPATMASELNLKMDYVAWNEGNLCAFMHKHPEIEPYRPAATEMTFYLGYKNSDSEELTQFESAEAATFDSEEWCAVISDTLENAKADYERQFSAWKLTHNKPI